MENLNTIYKKEVVHTLTRFQFATCEQLTRLFTPAHQIPSAEAMLELFDEHALGFRWFNIPTAGEHKPRKGQRTVRIGVCYLLAAAKKYGMPRNFVEPPVRKFPNQKRINSRMYHELNVLEVWLWFREHFEVIDCAVEDELRQFAGGTVPDLRVYFENYSQDCEIVVQNTRKDIEEKSRNLWWFTPSLRQAEVIENINKAIVHILPPLVPQAKVLREKPTTFSRLEQQVLAKIFEFRKPINAGALAKILGSPRQDVSSALSDLARKQVIYSTEIATDPGRSTGRPRKFYSKRPANFYDFEQRREIVEKSIFAQTAVGGTEKLLCDLFM